MRDTTATPLLEKPDHESTRTFDGQNPHPRTNPKRNGILRRFGGHLCQAHSSWAVPVATGIRFAYLVAPRMGGTKCLHLITT